MTLEKLQSEYPDLDKYKDDRGNVFYYKKGTKIYHNPYGPAIITRDKTLEYRIQYDLHRLDGPARIYADGDVEYWINNRNLGNSKQKFYTKIKNLDSKYINKQDKINILNIKNLLLDGLNNDSLSLLKSSL